MQTRIELKGDRNSPMFVSINTSECEEWSNSHFPLIIPMQTASDMDAVGYGEDDIERIMSLNVGEVLKDFDYEGVYVMRVS